MKFIVYKHGYTRKWYVVSEDGKICREFETKDEAVKFINLSNC